MKSLTLTLCMLIASCSAREPTANLHDGQSAEVLPMDADSDLRTQVKPPDQVLVEPADLMTSVRDTPLEISVGYVLNLPSDAVMESLNEGNVSLRTITGRQIPIRLTEIQLDTERPGPKLRRLQLVPLETIASEWHEVWLDFTGLELDPHPNLAPVQGRTYRSRFHPDSSPVLRSVELCVSPDTSVDLVVRLDFSEPLTFLPDQAAVTNPALAVSVDGHECAMIATFDRGGPTIDAFATAYQFRCAPSTSANSIQIELRRELRSVSGQAVALVRDSADSNLTLTFEQGYDLGCRYWHLP